MKEERTFKIEALASISENRVLCDPASIHDFAEYYFDEGLNYNHTKKVKDLLYSINPEVYPDFNFGDEKTYTEEKMAFIIMTYINFYGKYVKVKPLDKGKTKTLKI